MGRVCVCIGACGALVLSLFLATSSASAQSALLDALSTRVTLAHPSGSPAVVAVEQIIRSGDTVATDQTGRAVVTYPDGSTALLEENSALTIEFVRTSAGDYVIRMQQTLGRVWYAVTRAVTLGSRYEVHSAGMASVIRAGSDSYVSVSPSGETTIVTISG
ncbi:MAG TPA: FecR domain-containing protein, partial [Candidatus Udaeobacter sp.]|nr:FecR domain-containing protein [Candidatus Udaeobacter sp.]